MAHVVATVPKRSYHKHDLGWGLYLVNAELEVDGRFCGHVRELQEACSEKQAVNRLRDYIAGQLNVASDRVWLALTRDVDFISEEVVKGVREAGFHL